MELLEPVAPIPTVRREPDVEQTEERDVAMLLVALTLVAGLLGMTLELAEPTNLVRIARLLLVAVGTATIAGHALTARGRRREQGDHAPRDDAYPSWLVSVAPPAFAFAIALVSGWSADPSHAQRALFLAATIVSVDAACMWLTTAASRTVERGRRWIRSQLGRPHDDATGTVVDAGRNHAAGASVDAGRTVLVGADELVPVDLEVVEGDASVLSWVVGSAPLRRRAGDVVVAGSRVLSGQLRGVCTFSGDERALSRALFSTPHRPDVHSEVPRLAQRVVSRWALVGALVAAGLHAALRGKPLDVAMVAVSVYAALGSLSLAVLPSLTVARGLLLGIDRGVVFRDAQAWDRAAHATAAVFCARGTLLRGEPELVEIELFGRTDTPGRATAANDVLGLAAAALASEPTPIARALRRAARDRGLPRDVVRNARSHDGRGVTGVAGNGEAVCVGTRELMLERRVSVAAAEGTMAELESTGRTVLLVSRAGRLLGLCAFQDGLRTGARAAVQHLLDVGVEPVLMSSDTTATCEALGRALDIDHFRAEVREGDQGVAVERIRDGGAVVAVLGHAALDAVALRTADVAVALGQAGRSGEEVGVATVTDDVRDAAVAIALAQRWRKRAISTFGLVVAPAAFGSLVVAAGLLSPEYAPISQLLGTIAAAWQLSREDDV
jgi:Cu+-exporting ATPase